MKDAPWLAQVHAACFTHPRPWSEAEFEALVAQQSTILISLEQGFVLARAVKDEAEILTIAVLPKARNQGIGHQLLAQLQAVLRGKNVQYLFLEVSEDNTAALSLYYSNWFAESGRRSGYYRNATATAQDALILSKTLTTAPVPSKT